MYLTIFGQDVTSAKIWDLFKIMRKHGLRLPKEDILKPKKKKKNHFIRRLCVSILEYYYITINKIIKIIRLHENSGE